MDDPAEHGSPGPQTPACSPVAHAVHASGLPPGNVVQRYPAHLLDRKTRSTPEWAYFNGLLVRSTGGRRGAPATTWRALSPGRSRARRPGDGFRLSLFR